MTTNEKLIHCPISGPTAFAACPVDEVEPLVDFLKHSESVTEAKTFPRGTIMPDGRLDLCKQSIGVEGCRRVTMALKGSPVVRSLLFGTDGIGDEGARCVAELVGGGSPLEVIYLGCNGISDDGARELAAALANNTSVHGLWLKRNPIGDEGVFAIADLIRVNRSLHELDLVNTGFGNRGFTALIDALVDPGCSIRRLYLGGNHLNDRDAIRLADLLRSNTTLRALMLNVNRVRDSGAVAIADALRENETLEEIGLASNGLGDEGVTGLAKSITQHRSLKRLDLGYSPSTKVLGESENRIGNSGAAALAEMLRENTSLQRLDVTRTGISEEGWTAIADGLSVNFSLTELRKSGRMPEPVSQKLQQNRAACPASEKPDELAMIKSVYRTSDQRGAVGLSRLP